MEIEIAADSNGKYPYFNYTLGRSNILLGINGVGKTNLLLQIAKKFHPEIIFVGSNRPAHAFGSSTNIRDIKNMEDVSRVRGTITTHMRWEDVEGRLRETANLIFLNFIECKLSRKDAIVKWYDSGKNGPSPEEPAPIINRLTTLFKEIFPQINIVIREESNSIIAKKNGQNYDIYKMSEGEKQILILLTDLLLQKKDYNAIVVDDPDLHLHPSLAQKLWDALEAEFTNTTFVYATHSVAFALRPNVDKIFIIQPETNKTELIKNWRSIPDEEMRELLGPIPGLLSSKHALAIEGSPTSRDIKIYQWLLKDKTIHIQPLGSCNNVLKAVKSEGLWENLLVSTKIAGIIDRDHKTDKQMSCLEDKSLVILEYDEIESYLCDPEIICFIAKEREKSFSVPEIETIIINELEKRLHQIASSRANREISSTLPTNTCDVVPAKFVDELNYISDFADNLKKYYETALPELDELQKIFPRELEKLKIIVRKKNVRGALGVLPGKELFVAICNTLKLGLSHGQAVCILSKKHPDDFECTKKLRGLILDRLEI